MFRLLICKKQPPTKAFLKIARHKFEYLNVDCNWQDAGSIRFQNRSCMYMLHTVHITTNLSCPHFPELQALATSVATTWQCFKAVLIVALLLYTLINFILLQYRGLKDFTFLHFTRCCTFRLSRHYTEIRVPSSAIFLL